MIALCSKRHFVDDEQDSKKKKLNTKDMLKRQNNITRQYSKAALNGGTDRAKNRGFRMINGRITTYEQQNLGPSTYYD